MNTKEFKMKRYQFYRSQIATFVGTVDKWNIYTNRLSNDMRLGLLREFRAFRYIRKKYKKHKVYLTPTYQDYNGIDLIASNNMETKDKQTILFAISGPTDLEDHLNCDYKLIVYADKIYQKKIKKEE